MKLLKLLESIFLHRPSLGGHHTCHVYHSVVRRVINYCGNPDISVRKVFTKTFLKGLEERLRADGLKANTISSYMNALRALYAEALRLKAAPFVPGLFSDTFTGSAPTAKRAVTPDVVAQVISADLTDAPGLAVSRDLFVLSLLLHGISFVDLVHLTKSEVQGDTLVYFRQKTGTTVTVPILPNARLLLQKYASRSGGPYILCLLDPDKSGRVPIYDSVLRRHNRCLEALSLRLGLEVKLTSYVSRHTWATLAYHNDVNVAVVSEAMGHRTEAVTRIYLSALSHNHLRKAGRTVFEVILHSLRENSKKTPVSVKKSKRAEPFTMKTGCFAMKNIENSRGKSGDGVKEKCPSSCT